MAGLLAGLSDSAGGVTLNRLCGSGLGRPLCGTLSTTMPSMTKTSATESRALWWLWAGFAVLLLFPLWTKLKRSHPHALKTNKEDEEWTDIGARELAHRYQFG